MSLATESWYLCSHTLVYMFSCYLSTIVLILEFKPFVVLWHKHIPLPMFLLILFTSNLLMHVCVCIWCVCVCVLKVLCSRYEFWLSMLTCPTEKSPYLRPYEITNNTHTSIGVWVLVELVLLKGFLTLYDAWEDGNVMLSNVVHQTSLLSIVYHLCVWIGTW